MTPLPGPPPTPATNSNLVGLEEGPGVRISKPLGDSHKTETIRVETKKKYRLEGTQPCGPASLGVPRPPQLSAHPGLRARASGQVQQGLSSLLPRRHKPQGRGRAEASAPRHPHFSALRPRASDAHAPPPASCTSRKHGPRAHANSGQHRGGDRGDTDH